jgi:hypothetical protein
MPVSVLSRQSRIGLIGPTGEKGYVPKLPVSDKDNFHFTASPDTKAYLAGYKKALLAVRIAGRMRRI